MTMLVVANDVTTGFGVPVAAPGIRSAGIVEGLRSHGHDVELVVPRTILERVWTRPTPPSPPPGTTILDPAELTRFIAERAFGHVIFTNANMAPHLEPVAGTRFVYDMFAPKVLELLASGRTDRDWVDEARRKERALALADHVLVNGRRKLGYALGWLLRPSVDRIRTETFGLPRLLTGDPMRHLSLVEMPVPLPVAIDVRDEAHESADRLRVGMAGYAQAWSRVQGTLPAQQIPLDAGHEVHVLSPSHWGTGTEDDSSPPEGVVVHDGPLDYPAFARWIQSMDVIVDVFEQSAERHMAMITRTAVALRFGVPVIHGIDSEVSDLIREYDAGWVVMPDDTAGWRAAYEEVADPSIRRAKQAGAHALSVERFAPDVALAEASKALAAAR